MSTAAFDRNNSGQYDSRMDTPNVHVRSLSKSIPLLLVLFIMAATAVGRSFTAVSPGVFDARLFMYIGDQWLQGRIPYIEVWENKPPGIFALIALVFSQFPKSFAALAGMEGLFIIGCVATVYAIMRELAAPRMAAMTATAATAIACNLKFYNEGGILTEVYLLWPAALSMLCALRALRSNRLTWMIFAGLCSGLASVFKPPGLSPFLAQVTLLSVLFVLGRYPIRTVGHFIFANTGGVLLFWSIPLIYFWRHGALEGLLNASFLYNLSYGAASQPGLPAAFFNLLAKLRPLSSLAVGAVILAVFTIIVAAQRLRSPGSAPTSVIPCQVHHRWLILLWVIFDLAGALAMGNYYGHYFLPLAPSLSVSAGLACWLMLGEESRPTAPLAWRTALVALFIGPLLFELVSDVREMGRLIRYGPPSQSWHGAVKFLNSARLVDDTLFTWDYLPDVYFATGMKSPLRFLSAQHLYWAPAAREIFAAEIIKGLEREMPTFLIDRRRMPSAKRASEDPVYAEFQRLVTRHYDLVYTEKDTDLYIYNRRLNRPGP